MSTLPSIQLGSLTISRLVAGTNAVSGFSHANAKRSQEMLDYFTSENTKRYFGTCEQRGIRAVIARADAFIFRMFKEYWSGGGTIRWIAQTAPEHRDPSKNIAQAARWGASAIYVHGGMVDQAFDEGRPEDVRRLVERIRGLGLPAGMAAHNPEHLLKAQADGFPVDFFMVCLHNIAGYRGNQGSEHEERFEDEDRAIALAALRRLDRPCLAYKVLAAGRKTVREGLSDVARALRPHDGVVLGMFPPDREDVVGDNVATFNEVFAR